MRSRLIFAAVAMTLAAIPMVGQASSAVPRMPDGHPDLQGTYDLATMTPLERFPSDPPVLTKEQADKIEKAEMARRNKDATKLDPNRPELPVGGDTTAGKSFFEILEKAGGGAVGGYDRLWLHQGTAYTVVDGQIRTSIVVDPPNGRIPPFNAAARARRAAGARVLPTSDQAENSESKAPQRRGQADDPEQLALSLRCILGFGSTAGPPALPDYFYNDLHQIVQTKD